MIVQVTKGVFNYRIPFYRYLKSECSFHDLHFSYRIGISTASSIVREVFGLSCVQNVFPNLQNS